MIASNFEMTGASHATQRYVLWPNPQGSPFDYRSLWSGNNWHTASGRSFSIRRIGSTFSCLKMACPSLHKTYIFSPQFFHIFNLYCKASHQEMDSWISSEMLLSSWKILAGTLFWKNSYFICNSALFFHELCSLLSNKKAGSFPSWRK